ncbi:hypothetical protein Raf01_87960 [Rugosimonospora africana]|uniref:Uncharacterized protein n=1 Tax=Rugosimonospora africana TaxID=556532 RepID=A0A8J3R2K1_9ACTN|nr:hypothetical protein Raf01_87960 [Rugosimonospora africana]
MRGQFAGCPLERFAGPPESGEDVELAFGEAMPPVDDAQLLGEVAGEAVQPADHTLWPHVDIRPFLGPCPLDEGDMIEMRHTVNIRYAVNIHHPVKMRHRVGIRHSVEIFGHLHII